VALKVVNYQSSYFIINNNYFVERHIKCNSLSSNRQIIY